MADPVVKALEDLNRTLKEVVANQREQTRIQKALNHNLIQLFSKPSDPIEEAPLDPTQETPPSSGEVPYIPRTYGWSMAALVQRDGALVRGDVKIEQDDSRWTWTGEIWERTEEPSAREPD